MRKAFEIGGMVTAVVLVGFGVVAIIMGVNGRSTVNSSLQNEYIVGGSDMTPSAIKAEAQKAGITSAVKQWPTMSVADQTIDTGPEARAMSQYMHIHALEATGGFTYAQMGIYTAKPGTPKSQLEPGGGTEQQRVRRDRPDDQAAGAERRSADLDQRDRALERAQHELHGEPGRAVRDRGRDRTSPDGARVRDPRGRRGAPESGDRSEVPAAAGAQEDSRGARGISARLHRRTQEGRRQAALLASRGSYGKGRSEDPRRPRRPGPARRPRSTHGSDAHREALHARSDCRPERGLSGGLGARSGSPAARLSADAAPSRSSASPRTKRWRLGCSRSANGWIRHARQRRKTRCGASSVTSSTSQPSSESSTRVRAGRARARMRRGRRGSAGGASA